MGNRFLAGTASTFAHLLGNSPKPAAAKSKAEDDKDEKKEAARAESDDGRDDDEKKESARAEGDDPKDDDEGDKKDAKGKKAKADDGDDDDKKPDAESDDDEEEMRGKSAAASARRRERARCAAIFAAPDAAKNVALAANLAFKTTLTRSEAIAVLRDTPAASAPVAAGRSDRNPRLGPSGDASMTSKQAIASSWDAAAAKVPATKRR